MIDIEKRLFELQDKKYRDFQCRLMPNISPDRVIGVRTPLLRNFAKEVIRSGDGAEFISILPHKYYEENNLHAFILEKIKDYDECICALDAFLPYVDNWATCDSMKPAVLKKHLDVLPQKIVKWIDDSHEYTVRFAIEALMNYYLDKEYKEEYSRLVCKVRRDEYYIKMMVAWYFATALAKQYDSAVKYIENKSLDAWTHNKAIQKAVESYRITDEQKAYLRTLKITQK